MRTDLVRQQFGALLKGVALPDSWREVIRRKMVELAEAGLLSAVAIERKRERLSLKRARILKQRREIAV